MSFLPFSQNKINYYKSIEEMPIYNFHKFMISSNLKWILKDDFKYKSRQKKDKILTKQWEVLHDEYLLHFGISKNYQKVMEQEDKITNLMITRWLKDDKTLEAIIKIETLKLEELNGKKKKGSTFEEDIAVIEKHRSIGLNPKKTSVKMFYTYINLMRKDG